MKTTIIYKFTPEMMKAFYEQGKIIRIKEKDSYGNEKEVHIVPTASTGKFRNAEDGKIIIKKVIA